MPLISVIIPAYNAEKTIQETVESVLQQTCKDFELIVVDDGSQDATVEIITKITDSRLRLIKHSHGGANRSRNLGLSQAIGSYVAFLDADDLWTSEKLESQLNALEANPHAAVAYSWTDRIDESGQFLRRGGYVSVNGNVLAKLLIVNFVENGSNPLIRTKAAIAVGGFDESLSACQDWDLWLKLAARYSFVSVSAQQILYRLSSGSISSNVFMLAAACVKVTDRAFAAAPDSLQHLKKPSLGNTYKYLIFKSFEEYPHWKRGIAAAKFLYHVIENDPAILRTQVIRRILLNIAIVTFLPPQQAHALRQRLKDATDMNPIFQHFQTDPDKL